MAPECKCVSGSSIVITDNPCLNLICCSNAKEKTLLIPSPFAEMLVATPSSIIISKGLCLEKKSSFFCNSIFKSMTSGKKTFIGSINLEVISFND